MKTKLSIVLLTALLFISGCALMSGASIAQSEINMSVPKATISGNLDTSLLPTLEPTREPDPFSIQALKNRTYGNGEITVDRLWYSYEEFERYYVIYDSDGLSIHGYVNVPLGEGPFPVIVMLHGYIPPEEYTTLDYTIRYADDLARNGYIVLHPNLRNFPPSDSVGRNHDSNAGYTIDVLNLLAYFKEMAGKEGIFASADINRIGIWGHSIGGSIAMRTMSTVPDAFKAAVLYGAVSQRYGTVLDDPDIYDLSEVEMPISIHHGVDDSVISVDQSRTLCNQLQQLGKSVDCYFYEGQPHTLYRDQWADPLFMDRVLEFFDRYVKNG